MQPWQPDEEPHRTTGSGQPGPDLAPERRRTLKDGAEPGTDGPEAILVGVDGTPASLRALAYAAGVARRQRAELIAVYVRSPLRSHTTSGWIDPGIAAAEAQAQRETEDELRTQITEDANTWGTGARIVVRNGNPLQELRKVAEGTGADTIIVGASASLGHRLYGSLGPRLLRRRPCPVTIVP